MEKGGDVPNIKKMSSEEKEQYYLDRAFEQMTGRFAADRTRYPLRNLLNLYGYPKELTGPTIEDWSVKRPYSSDNENIKFKLQQKKFQELPKMPLGGEVSGMFLDAATNPSSYPTSVPYNQTKGWNYGTQAAGIAANLLSSAAAQNSGAMTHPEYLPGNNTAQQSVDSVAGAILPGYGLGKAVGNYAKTDYMAQNEFGELANTSKFETADTIGMFIDPLGSFISGLSGEGWTPKQRADKINSQGASNRRKHEQQDWANYVAMDKASGNAGRYADTNQMLQAKFGGPIQVPYLEAMAYGGPLTLNGFNGQGSMMDFEKGGPIITEYNVGGEHDENPNGGIPTDAMGNKAVVSGTRPTVLTEAGELSWYNPKTKKAFVFSNKLFIDEKE